MQYFSNGCSPYVATNIKQINDLVSVVSVEYSTQFQILLTTNIRITVLFYKNNQ